MSTAPREVCPRCRRPSAVCYCPHLVSLPTSTRVVFLQHPREARVPIGTARMAHLMLRNSEIHQGILFGDHQRLRQVVADPAAALLFPGEGALDPAALAEGTVRTLVVVDGTWAQARKVIKQNPLLLRLPRIGVVPARPGNYRIRREPAADCLATVEAVSSVLGTLERDPERFAAMLAAFTFMVDRQIELAAARTGPRRRCGRLRQAQAEAQLRALLARAVVVHAEVNAHPRGSGLRGRPELLHLAALRLATGESFQAIVAPQRPLAPSAHFHLGLERARLLSGEPIAAALERWRTFLMPQDVQCGWGHFTRDLLTAEGASVGDWLDLRLPVAKLLQTSPGAPRQAAQRLGAPVAERTVAGRAGQTVAELGHIAAWLVTRAERSAAD